MGKRKRKVNKKIVYTANRVELLNWQTEYFLELSKGHNELTFKDFLYWKKFGLILKRQNKDFIEKIKENEKKAKSQINV